MDTYGHKGTSTLGLGVCTKRIDSWGEHRGKTHTQRENLTGSEPQQMREANRDQA